MTMRVLAVIAVAGALVCGACGGDESPEEGSDAAADAAAQAEEGRPLGNVGADRRQYIGESGTATKTACELVGLPTVERIVGEHTGAGREPLERTANNSLDLSFCEFRERSGDDIFVRIGLDTATRAVRRYYNLITEARQLPNIFDPAEAGRPKLVFGVGDDGTYGGAGAFWIPSRLDLASIKDQRIVRVHFYVPGTPDRAAKRAAAELARLAFAGYED